jgi:hypothetical protein
LTNKIDAKMPVDIGIARNTKLTKPRGSKKIFHMKRTIVVNPISTEPRTN